MTEVNEPLGQVNLLPRLGEIHPKRNGPEIELLDLVPETLGEDRINTIHES
jgi:hypothetical protein